MSNGKGEFWYGILMIIVIFTVVILFFFLLTGCTAGRDACYICVGPSLEIEFFKSKKDVKPAKTEAEKEQEKE